MNLFKWSAVPEGLTPREKKNFLNVEIDAAGVGLASAASPFLPVFLARLGASNFQVGLLTAMPAMTGLLLAIPIGRFLQHRRQVVPWFSGARLLALSAYALTGLVTLLVPREHAVSAVLLIWAMVTLTRVVVNVCFSVVMNAVAGPKGRFELLSRRWTILGLTTTVTVAAVGLILDRLNFPLNYQVVFLGLSLGGLVSYYYSSHIDLPDAEPPPRAIGLSVRERFKGFVALIRNERAFVSFTAKRFVYMTGTALAAPLFPLYFVREVNATDAWIGIISTVQTGIMLLGYALWLRQSKVRGSRYVLLWTTFGLAFYPALTAFTRQVELIVLYAGLAGIFQAGLDLVFFDELMKTFPARYSATFVSLAQSLEHFSTIAAPLVGTLLADYIGLSGALLVSTGLRLLGFALFALKSQSLP